MANRTKRTKGHGATTEESVAVTTIHHASSPKKKMMMIHSRCACHDESCCQNQDHHHHSPNDSHPLGHHKTIRNHSRALHLRQRVGGLLITQVLLILIGTWHVSRRYPGHHPTYDSMDGDTFVLPVAPEANHHHDNHHHNDNQACRQFFRPVENATWMVPWKQRPPKPLLPVHGNITTTTTTNTSLSTKDNDTSFRIHIPQSLPTVCGTLRRPWWEMVRQREAQDRQGTPESPQQPSSSSSSSLSTVSLSHQIAQHQTNCSAPVMRFDMDNNFGLGSHFVLWSQALCNAWEQGYRLWTYNPTWLWRDQVQCGTNDDDDDDDVYESPWDCYFANVEHTCPSTHTTDPQSLPSVPDPRDRKFFCQRLNQNNNHNKDRDNTNNNITSALEELRHFRAQSFAYLFRHVTPTVLHEAERQIGLLFGRDNQQNNHNGRVMVPPDCIAVHIRWGDKFWEMDLVDIPEYIQAIQHILDQRQMQSTDHDPSSITTNDSTPPQSPASPRPVHIYVATEDPKAAQAFVEAVRANETTRHWHIALDVTLSELNPYRPTKGNRASWTTRHTRGRAGLVALGSLLVALEARDMVVTTKSNWSRLWVALHRELFGQTEGIVVDLRPGDW